MPTWARGQSPTSTSPSPTESPFRGVPSPSLSSPAEVRRSSALSQPPWFGGGQAQRRSSSAPAARAEQRGRAAEAQPSHGQSHSQRRLVNNRPVRQPQQWGGQRGHEASCTEQRGVPANGGRQQRPWMMIQRMRSCQATSTERHLQDDEEVTSPPARASGMGPRPGRGGATSFTPPARSTLRHLQGHSGAKQPAPPRNARKSNAAPRSKSSSSAAEVSRRPLAPRASGGKSANAPRQSQPVPASWHHHQSVDPASPPQHAAALGESAEAAEQVTTSELQKENSELRALAQRLSEKLAAAERRERWYQSSAQELQAAGQGSPSDGEESDLEGSELLSPQQARELESLHRLADRAMEDVLAPRQGVVSGRHLIQLRASPLRVASEVGGIYSKSFEQHELFHREQQANDQYLPEHSFHYNHAEGADFDAEASDDQGEADEAAHWSLPPRTIWS